MAVGSGWILYCRYGAMTLSRALLSQRLRALDTTPNRRSSSSRRATEEPRLFEVDLQQLHPMRTLASEQGGAVQVQGVAQPVGVQGRVDLSSQRGQMVPRPVQQLRGPVWLDLVPGVDLPGRA